MEIILLSYIKKLQYIGTVTSEGKGKKNSLQGSVVFLCF